MPTDSDLRRAWEALPETDQAVLLHHPAVARAVEALEDAGEAMLSAADFTSPADLATMHKALSRWADPAKADPAALAGRLERSQSAAVRFKQGQALRARIKQAEGDAHLLACRAADLRHRLGLPGRAALWDEAARSAYALAAALRDLEA